MSGPTTPTSNLRRTVKPGSSRTAQTCVRKGCRKKITKMAALHGDPYCSKECYMLDHPAPASEGE